MRSARSMTLRRSERGHAGCGAPVLIAEVGEDGDHPRLPRDGARGRKIEHRMRIGVARVPAGDLRVVVEHVGEVPTEDDVAEAEARSGGLT